MKRLLARIKRLFARQTIQLPPHIGPHVTINGRTYAINDPPITGPRWFHVPTPRKP